MDRKLHFQLIKNSPSVLVLLNVKMDFGLNSQRENTNLKRITLVHDKVNSSKSDIHANEEFHYKLICEEMNSYSGPFRKFRLDYLNEI